ncbi:MAG: ArsR/SmtB family transcription factor [Rhizobiaceae bacterium]
MSDLVSTFAALGDSTRFAIVERLMNSGELSAGDLQSVAKISAPAISRHLKVLREAGIVSQRIDKQRRIYSVEPESVKAITDWTMSHEEFWNGSLDRLAAALKNED